MSDESMRRAGRAELDRLNAGAKKPAQTPQKKRLPAKEKPKRDLVRRFGPNGKSVDEVVDEAVSGAKLSY
jgi:hypothetical protein